MARNPHFDLTEGENSLGQAGYKLLPLIFLLEERAALTREFCFWLDSVFAVNRKGVRPGVAASTKAEMCAGASSHQRFLFATEGEMPCFTFLNYENSDVLGLAAIRSRGKYAEIIPFDAAYLGGRTCRMW